MKRADMAVGSEYLATSYDDWSIRENSRGARVRLVDAGNWWRYVQRSGDGEERREVETDGGTVNLPASIGRTLDTGEVLVEVLDAETGEPQNPPRYTTCLSRSIRGDWTECIRLRDLNLAAERERRAAKRAEKEAIRARTQAVHDFLGTERQADYYSKNVVVLELDKAEAIMQAITALEDKYGHGMFPLTFYPTEQEN